MPIDYTKRPSTPPPPPPPPAGATPPPPPPPAASGPVVLTKSAPTISLSKTGGASGVLRVNLNWNAKPAGGGGGGFLKNFTKQQQLDLDLGCLWELTDGSKGVVQALGNAFYAPADGGGRPIIALDGDDRSGTNTGGENLSVDLSQLQRIRRILVFALIYEGAANWASAQGVATLYPAHGAPIVVNLDDPRDGARICAIAMLENTGNDLQVRREVNYVNGGQRLLDETYGWGMRWTAGRK